MASRSMGLKRTAAALAAASVLLGCTPDGPAAVITWDTPQNISGTSDVSTEGTYFGSWAPGNANAGWWYNAVNGVVFQGWDDLGIGASGFDGNGEYFTWHNTPNGTYNGLLNWGVFSWDGDASFTLNGTGAKPLTIGQQYLIQFWVSDPRNTGADRFQSISGSEPLSFPGNGSGMGQFVIGRFTADTTSQQFVLSATHTAQINLLQVRVVPEPGTLTMLTCGLLGSAALHRRFRRRVRLPGVAWTPAAVLRSATPLRSSDSP